MWEKYIEKLPKLSSGSHKEGSGSLCAMEMVAFMERLPHSDAPECTCPVLASYTRTINDGMSDEERQKLLPILPMLVGTANKEMSLKRAQFFATAAKERFVPMCGEEPSKVWDEAIQVLVEAIELDPERVVAQWQADSVEKLIKEFS
ncbi:MAG: hypothetical protein ACO23H_12090 [Alphaproteobacteria bacterium]